MKKFIAFTFVLMGVLLFITAPFNSVAEINLVKSVGSVAVLFGAGVFFWEIVNQERQRKLINALYVTKDYAAILKLYNKYGYEAFAKYELEEEFLKFLKQRFENILKTSHYANILEAKIAKEYEILTTYITPYYKQEKIITSLEKAFFSLSENLSEKGFEYWMKFYFAYESIPYITGIISSLPWKKNSDETEFEFNKRLIDTIEKYSSVPDTVLNDSDYQEEVRRRKEKLVTRILNSKNKREWQDQYLKVV